MRFVQIGAGSVVPHSRRCLYPFFLIGGRCQRRASMFGQVTWYRIGAGVSFPDFTEMSRCIAARLEIWAGALCPAPKLFAFCPDGPWTFAIGPRRRPLSGPGFAAEKNDSVYRPVIGTHGPSPIYLVRRYRPRSNSLGPAGRHSHDPVSEFAFRPDWPWTFARSPRERPLRRLAAATFSAGRTDWVYRSVLVLHGPSSYKHACRA